LPALRVVQWNVDPVFEPDNIARIRSKLDVVDATLVSTAGEALAPLRRRGMMLGFLPNPVDFSIESARADLDADPPFDLFYACGHPRSPPRHLFGRDWDMDDFFRQLRGQVPGLRAFVAGIEGQPTIAGGPYQDALGRCAAGLNASRRQDWLLYSSDRLAHMVGNGLAVLMDRGSGYGTLFGEDQMLFFATMEELAAQIRRVMADGAWRQAVASAGRARYHALFNETVIARYVVDVAFDAHDPARYEWPTLLA
jgi:hypothetical protein